ncbi:hypothetical protein KCV01_g1430, partial [Aureobasidium melanogenum]
MQKPTPKLRDDRREEAVDGEVEEFEPVGDTDRDELFSGHVGIIGHDRHGDARQASAPRMHMGIQRAPGTRPLDDLDTPCHAVPAESQSGPVGQFPCLDDPAVRQGDGQARRDVATGLDHAVVAQGDTDAGVRADKATCANGHHPVVATGDATHERCAATDMAAFMQHHARADATFDHAGTERTGVEAAKAFRRHRGTGGEMGAQQYPRRFADTDVRERDGPEQVDDLVVRAATGHDDAGAGIVRGDLARKGKPRVHGVPGGIQRG